MPSFDFSSEVDMLALKNAIDVTSWKNHRASRFQGNDRQGRTEREHKIIALFGDSDFQLNQVKDILFPEMEKKEPDSTKRLTLKPCRRFLATMSSRI